MCSLDYGPHYVEYPPEPCQTCSSLLSVDIPMIWNTPACNTSCNERTAAIYMPPVPPVTIPICVGEYYRLWSPLRWVSMQAIRYVFSLAMYGYTNDLKYHCMQHALQWTHRSHLYANTTPSHHTHFGAWVALIMVPTPLSMYASHVRGFCICSSWPYQCYEIPLHAIDHVVIVLQPIPCYHYGQWPYPFLVGV